MTAVSASLPPLPRLRFVASAKPARGEAFVRVEPFELRFVEGPASGQRCDYDLVRRRAIDAVVMVAFTRPSEGRFDVFLRSALRPPLALRDDGVALEPGLWELPAGLVERGESPRAAAARELFEELGLRVTEEELVPLGGAVVPAPALIGERQWGFAVDVTDRERSEPELDGGLLELGGVVARVDAQSFVERLADEALVDAKTELFLGRFLRSVR
jgi:8-oxo-dGTP pyrophosphatase MutT (NUDIX family)